MSGWTTNEWWTYAAMALAILVLLYLLLRLLKRRRKQKQQAGGLGQGGSGGQGSGQGGSQESERKKQRRAEQARRNEQRRKAQEKERRKQEQIKIQKVKTFLKDGDEQLAKLVLQMMNVRGELKDVSKDEEMVKAIAKSINPQILESLRLANEQSEIDINLRKQVETVQVNYPTDQIDVLPMDDFSQMTEIMPEDMILPEEEFYRQLANQELMIPRYFDQIVKKKLGYVLLDISGSMEQKMRNRMPRHVVARGLTLNLLIRAKQGDAKYFLRPFDGGVHHLQKATTPEECEKVMRFVIERAFSGGRTNILGAIETAVNDIRTLGGDISESEILLISDGEDRSVNDIGYVKELLGEDIRIHVVMIGRENDHLKKVAHYYRSIK